MINSHYQLENPAMPYFEQKLPGVRVAMGDVTAAVIGPMGVPSRLRIQAAPYLGLPYGFPRGHWKRTR